MSTDIDPSSAERFDELLPFYVNGTLADADRAFVEAHLAAHPEARAEAQFYRSLQRRMQESGPAVPETIGLARTLQLIRGDQPSFGERVAAFFGGFGMRPAPALAALALVAVQGAVIWNLMGDAKDDAAEIRSLRAASVDEQPLLKISFAPDAREADIRLLLVAIDGQLAGGPGQLGDYYVRVPQGRLDAALQRLKNDPLVQAAATAPGLPPRE